MTIPQHTGEVLVTNRLVAATLAVLGAASAIPIPLAQLDFAGLINVFNIGSGGSPRALLVIVGVAGFLTFAVLAVALGGAFLAATGAPSARPLLLAAALAGLVTAMPLWIPAGVLIGGAALMLGHPRDRLASDRRPNRNLLPAAGIDPHAPRHEAT